MDAEGEFLASCSNDGKVTVPPISLTWEHILLLYKYVLWCIKVLWLHVKCIQNHWLFCIEHLLCMLGVNHWSLYHEVQQHEFIWSSSKRTYAYTTILPLKFYYSVLFVDVKQWVLSAINLVFVPLQSVAIHPYFGRSTSRMFVYGTDKVHTLDLLLHSICTCVCTCLRNTLTSKIVSSKYKL